jgi:flagellar protein FlbD
MILLHRLNGSEMYINAKQIEMIEATPDTVIKLMNDKTYIVRESVGEVIDKVIKYYHKINEGILDVMERKEK